MKLNRVTQRSSAVAGARSLSGRHGFTLVELLIVVSIIGIMVGLIVAAAIKFKDAQMAATTDNQLVRFQRKLDDDYGAVLQRCQKDRPSERLSAYCGDVELARAVHTATTLRVNFPESFVEANTGYVIGEPTFGFRTVPPGNANGGVQFYPPKKTFATIPNVSTGSPDKERAVLLYLILTERSTGGGSGDETGSPGERRTENIGGKDFTYFIDVYGQPVTYYRWGWATGTAQNDELNQAPFARASAGNNRDPLDSRGLVARWSAASPNTQATNPEIVQIRSLLQFSAYPTAAPVPVYGNNRQPSVVSFGKNKKFDGFAGDDRIGYRAIRLGAKGDLDQ